MIFQLDISVIIPTVSLGKCKSELNMLIHIATAVPADGVPSLCPPVILHNFLKHVIPHLLSTVLTNSPASWTNERFRHCSCRSVARCLAVCLRVHRTFFDSVVLDLEIITTFFYDNYYVLKNSLPRIHCWRSDWDTIQTSTC